MKEDTRSKPRTAMPTLAALLYRFFSVNSPVIHGRFYLRNFKAVSGGFCSTRPWRTVLTKDKLVAIIG